MWDRHPAERPNTPTKSGCKFCVTCKQTKLLSEFSSSGKSRKGIQTYESSCVACRAANPKGYPDFKRRGPRRHRNPVIDGQKKCSRCGEMKTLDSFAKSLKGNRYASWCRRCVRDLHLREKYGISMDEYDRLFVIQRGLCAICGRPERAGKRPEFLEDRPGVRLLSVDHDHETGKVRALVCDRCNAGLGLFEDDPLRLRAAADYLERFRP